MVDYAINTDFDAYLNEWDDFATVDGLQEFEQDVAITIHHLMQDVVQHGFSERAKQKIKLAISRTAKEYNVIDSIERVLIEEPIDSPQTYEVTIQYATAEPFSETF